MTTLEMKAGMAGRPSAQATRRGAQPPAIAVASGKGGVGKTFLAVNLSVALARGGLRVGLVDADVGLANANLLLGIDPIHSLADVVSGSCAPNAAFEQGPAGVQLLSGGRGHVHVADLTSGARERLQASMAPLYATLDLLVIDTAPGLGADARDFTASAAIVLVVIAPEPAAFIDAYALLKAMALDNDRHTFWVVTNLVADKSEGRRLFDRFAAVVRRFLPAELMWAGAVPADPLARAAALQRVPLVDRWPQAPAANAITRLGARLAAHLARDVAATTSNLPSTATPAQCLPVSAAART
jgi:flagellar biosynthesis protein FlhG